VVLPSPADVPASDQQLQKYLRAAAARGRDVEQIGPFLATFDRQTDHRYLNYAIPEDGAQPTTGDVAALIDAYRRRGRLPRLEFLPGAAPYAESALLAGGFAVEGRLPAMTCAPGQAADVAPPAGFALGVPAGDDDLRAMSTVQHAAFGDGPPDAAAIARSRAAIGAGALAVFARAQATGEIVGGGATTVPGGGVAEVVGIGVAEPYRRRGLAAAITARLTHDAFAAGVTTAYLTPGDDGAHRVYGRAGYVDTTVMLHISLPER
jgi:GNAT superfamily N-acetyltransferase